MTPKTPSSLMIFQGEEVDPDNRHHVMGVLTVFWWKIQAVARLDRNYGASGHPPGDPQKCVATAIVMPGRDPLIFDVVTMRYYKFEMPVDVAVRLYQLEWVAPTPIGVIDQLGRLTDP